MVQSVSGCAAVWLIHQRFETERGQVSQVEMSEQMSLTFGGCLEVYLDSLDAIVIMFLVEPDEDLLLAYRKANFL